VRLTGEAPLALSTVRMSCGVVAAAAVAALVAGCAAAASPAPAPDSARIFSTTMSQAQTLTINTAQQELERRCMAKAGLRFRISPQAAKPVLTKGGDTNPLLVNTSLLRNDGYGLYQVTASSRGQRAGPADPNVTYLKSLTSAQRARWSTTFQGTAQEAVTLPDGSRLAFPKDGCYARALGELYGSVTRYYALQDYAGNLVSRIGIQAGWSAGWQRAQAEWRRCMTAAGYPYANETAAELRIYDRYQVRGTNRASVHSYELRVAARDAGCADKARFAAAGRAAVRQAAASFTADQVDAVLSWNQMQAHALTIASQVLGQG
jgi:hypothetical protein